MATRGAPSFDLSDFIADCSRAVRDSAPIQALHEVVARAVSEPRAVLQALGERRRAEIQKLFHSPELTILDTVWAPHMTVYPHDHRMPAIIGIYSGREDNIFWRRRPGATDGKLDAAGAHALAEGEAAVLPRDAIHSVTNPILRFTHALHVYAGDFFQTARSEWDPETLLERSYDVQKAMRLFEDANARLA